MKSQDLGIEQYLDVFKALSDVTRLKMMWLLYSIDSKISVSEMIEVLQINQYNASKHLKILKDAGMIYRKKDGRWKYYYYINKDTRFDTYIKKTVMEIPRELIEQEVLRCKMRLTMRDDCVEHIDCEICTEREECLGCEACIDREKCIDYKDRLAN